MTLKKSKYFLTAILILSLGTLAFAQKKEEKEIRDASDRAQQAAKVFNRIMADADKSIPRELLERAEAVAVFPGVLKAAFIVGGRGGGAPRRFSSSAAAALACKSVRRRPIT
jgi:lipid-binding SYLF domain-containing protein